MEEKLFVLYIGSSSGNIDCLKIHPGISVAVRDNSLEFVKFLKEENKPDAVISEVSLSGGNGFELFHWFRERPVFDNIPFILVAHQFREEWFKTAFSQHVDDFYVTPLPDAENVASRIRFLCEYRSRRASSQPKVVSAVVYEMPLIKRVFDILVAVTALLLLSPLLLLVMLAIRVESKGKVYYISKRVGRKPFDFYKLRSMRVGSDAQLNELAKGKTNMLPIHHSPKLILDYPVRDAWNCLQVRPVPLSCI